MLIHREEKSGFDICFFALEEYDSPLDVFGDDECTREEMEKINSGELVYFCAKVTASKNGIELGSDYLGCCAYESYDQFWKEPGYYPDMVNCAIEEAKKSISLLCGCAKKVSA